MDKITERLGKLPYKIKVGQTIFKRHVSEVTFVVPYLDITQETNF